MPLGTPITLTFSVCRIANLKIQLAKLDSEAWPGVLDSERDRLILINEKEELLKEMRFISPRKWTQGEVEQLEMARKRLEKDLQAARDTQSKALTERWGSAGACGDGDLLSVLVCALAPSLGKRRSGGGAATWGPWAPPQKHSGGLTPFQSSTSGDVTHPPATAELYTGNRCPKKLLTHRFSKIIFLGSSRRGVVNKSD